MSRIENFLLENETYEDGLKRALRLWAAQEEELQAVVRAIANGDEPPEGWLELIKEVDDE